MDYQWPFYLACLLCVGLALLALRFLNQRDIARSERDQLRRDAEPRILPFPTTKPPLKVHHAPPPEAGSVFGRDD